MILRRANLLRPSDIACNCRFFYRVCAYWYLFEPNWPNYLEGFYMVMPIIILLKLGLLIAPVLTFWCKVL